MANFFLIHTPFHQFVVEKIIGQQDNSSDEKNILIYEFEKNIEHSGACEEIDFIYVGGRVPGRQRSQAAEENMQVLRRHMLKYEENTMYLSDIAWPMNNRIFFDQSLRCRRFLYIDGIGNYVGQIVTYRLFIRNILKWAIGIVGFGVRYTPYIGDVVGQCHEKTELVHGFSIEHLAAPLGRCKEIKVSKSNVLEKDVRLNCGVFLDQPYIKGYSGWDLLRRQTMKQIRSLKVPKWYYKPHHFGRLADGDAFIESGFQRVESRECVEKLFEKEYYPIVVSYNSTALFTLKIIYGNDIRCIALDEPNLILAATQNDKDANPKLLLLFEKVGVEVISLTV